MSEVRFTAYVHPEPQGSTKGFVLRGKWGAKDRAILTSSNPKLKPYRGQVTREAVVALETASLPQPMAGKHVPVSMTLDFYFAKPPSVPKKRIKMAVKPDLSKLIRATEDAFIGLLYADDAQIVETIARKHYGTPERVEVIVGIVDCSPRHHNRRVRPARKRSAETLLKGTEMQKSAAKKLAKEVKKGPRQQRLPEMEDSKISVLEDHALSYAEVRDERMGLSKREVELKGKLLDLMKAQKKEHYKRGNIKIDTFTRKKT